MFIGRTDVEAETPKFWPPEIIVNRIIFLFFDIIIQTPIYFIIMLFRNNDYNLEYRINIFFLIWQVDEENIADEVAELMNQYTTFGYASDEDDYLYHKLQ